MNAQEVINSAKEPADFMAMFYPREFERRQVDSNITKILRDLR